MVYHPHFYGNLLYSSEGVEVINSVAFQDDPESDNEYLSGFKNDKVWFGIYEMVNCEKNIRARMFMIEI